MVSLTIDGKSVQVEGGTTILEAAATVGIKIPTLCWLQKVSPTGACRVCAVEVAGVDRTMTACNTPVKEGIAVTTNTPALQEMRKKVMELMLVNHPLDCPVCDAGGECDLQDACYGLSATKQEFSALLERRAIRYDWPLIESDPNRCILCEKCVKVDHEVVGCDAIAVVNKGEATIIDTVDGKPLDCEFCGNCIAACPTGTLISKPFKFKGRPWTYKKVESVCAFCGNGCQIEYHEKDGLVDRVTSGDGTFNNGNLCINGRFGYSYLASADRLTTPMVRDKSGALVGTDWDAALSAAAGKLSEIVARDGASAVAGLGSPRVTNEESFLFQKFLRVAVGTNNIDSEARLGFAQAQKQLVERFGFSGASATIDRLDDAEAIIVFGCDLNAEATGSEYRVIKAATKRDAKLLLVNMRDVKLKKFANLHLKNLPGSELSLIHGIMKALVETGTLPAGAEGVPAQLSALSFADLTTACGVAEDAFRAAAALVAGKEKVAIVFGADLIRSQGAQAKIAALADLAVLTGSAAEKGGGIFPVDAKNNTVGMLDMGVAPDTLPGLQDLAAGCADFAKAWGAELSNAPGKDLWGIIEGIERDSIKALYLLGCDLAGFPENERIRKALAKLELLIVQDIFAGDSATFAHVVFPAAAAAEKSGSFTTTDNRVQTVLKAAQAPGQAREDGEIITELYNRVASSKLEFSAGEMMKEITALSGSYRFDASSCRVVKRHGQSRVPIPFAPVSAPAAVTQPRFQLLVGPIGFHNGSSTTRSPNNLSVSPTGYVELYPSDAQALGVAEGARVKVTSGAGTLTATVKISGKLQPGLLFAPSHFRQLNANALLKGGGNLAEVKVEKA